MQSFNGRLDVPAESTLSGQADREYGSRLDAERSTLELKQRSARKLDAGKRPIEESPLFGAQGQMNLFDKEPA